jgi:hypothetical protein
MAGPANHRSLPVVKSYLPSLDALRGVNALVALFARFYAAPVRAWLRARRTARA